MAAERDLESEDYRALSEFRYQIRRFLRFSEKAAREAGVEPQQHQVLLAVKGIPDGVQASVGEIADRLQVVHHSAVELVDRLEEQALVQRRRSIEDRRQVIISLTPKGERVLRDLTLSHRKDLQANGPRLISALKRAMALPPVKKSTGRLRRDGDGATSVRGARVKA